MAAKKDKFHAVVILDRSGSMETVRDQTIDGLNEYINGQKKEGGDMLFTLALFDHMDGKLRLKYLYDANPISAVKVITRDDYDPTGGTPLYDAIGTVVKKVESEYTGKKKKQGVFVTIFTDGMENSSKEYNSQSVSALTKSKEADGWNFTYFGANHDAWAAAAAVGIPKGFARNYAKGNIAQEMVYANLVTNDSRRAYAADVQWAGEAAMVNIAKAINLPPDEALKDEDEPELESSN